MLQQKREKQNLNNSAEATIKKKDQNIYTTKLHIMRVKIYRKQKQKTTCKTDTVQKQVLGRKWSDVSVIVMKTKVL